MVSLRSATACVLVAVVAGSAARAATYEEALQAYWREDNVAAAEMMVDVMDREPGTTNALRAVYVFSLLMDGKLTADQMGPVRAKLAAMRSPLADYFAGSEAARSGQYAEAFSRLAKFVAEAPSDDFRILGLRAFCIGNWHFNSPLIADGDVARRFIAAMRQAGFKECTENLRVIVAGLLEFARRVQDRSTQAAVARFQFDLQPNPSDAYAVLEALLQAGLSTEAAEFVDEAIARLPATAETYSDIAREYDTANRPDDAVKILQRGVETLGSNDCSMGMAMARAHELQGRIRDALDALERIAPVCSQARLRLDQLRATTPEKYVQAWRRGLDDRICKLAVEDGYGVVALSINGGWATLFRLGEKGDSFNRIRLQDEIRWQEERVRFAVLPDGSFLIGAQVFDPDSLAVAPKTPLPPPDEALGRAAASVQATVFATARCGQHLVVAKDDGLVVFDAAGNLLREVRCPTNAPHALTRIRDLATDEDGLIYVAQWNEQGIYVLDSEFRFLAKIPGLTMRLAVDRKGAVYRTSFGDIEKFEPRDGGARALAETAAEQTP